MAGEQPPTVLSTGRERRLFSSFRKAITSCDVFMTHFHRRLSPNVGTSILLCATSAVAAQTCSTWFLIRADRRPRTVRFCNTFVCAVQREMHALTPGGRRRLRRLHRHCPLCAASSVLSYIHSPSGAFYFYVWRYSERSCRRHQSYFADQLAL